MNFYLQPYLHETLFAGVKELLKCVALEKEVLEGVQRTCRKNMDLVKDMKPC